MGKIIIFVLLFLAYGFSQIPNSNVAYVIFQDDLSTVSDWSWGITPTIDSTISKQGKSLKLAFPPSTGKWPGVYLQFKTAIDASKVKSIELDVYSTVVPKLILWLKDPNNVQYSVPSFGSTLKSNVFTHLSIPTTFFQATTIQSLILQTTDDAYSQTLYLDNVYLASTSSGNNANSTSNQTNNSSTTNTSSICLNNKITRIQSRGNIPTALPDKFLVGLFFDDPNPTWMKDSAVPWDVQYRYFVKGWVNNWGWGNYDGTFAYNFFTKAYTDGYIPAVQYYQMVAESPYAYDESKFVAKLQNKDTMKSYFGDFILFMKNVKNYGKPVLVLMEADGFGFCQFQSNENPATYAAIADTGLAELKDIPNTVAGFGLALLQIRKALGATNAYMGIHISGWATKKDLLIGSVTDPIQPEIDKLYNFLLPFGLNKNNVVGEEWDFLVNDPSDRDADFYRLTTNTNHWWDASDSASINSASFNRHIEYLRLLNQKFGKKIILWQIPLGNSQSKNVPNSNKNVAGEGYKDNRAEYFFGDDGKGICHSKRYAEAGVYALLFGRGEGQQSNYVNDVYSDGQLFMKTRVKKNYYDLGGVALNRTGI